MIRSTSILAASAAALSVSLCMWPVGGSDGAEPPAPIRALIVTGETHPAHDWKATTPAIVKVISAGGRVEADVSTRPADDLTDANLARYDVVVLNYFDFKKPPENPELAWSDANKAALLKAVKQDGKGLVLVHHASGAFTEPNWAEFEKAVGGWRKQGFHGPAHAFQVKKASSLGATTHPIAADAPEEFDHAVDELYQNCLVPEGSIVLATAYSDPAKPRGTGKDEAVIWASNYGKGRIFEDVLGHDVAAITDPGAASWLRKGVEWAATGKVAAPPAK